jgi:hypothetical protein
MCFADHEVAVLGDEVVVNRRRPLLLVDVEASMMELAAIAPPSTKIIPGLRNLFCSLASRKFSYHILEEDTLASQQFWILPLLWIIIAQFSHLMYLSLISIFSYTNKTCA